MTSQSWIFTLRSEKTSLFPIFLFPQTWEYTIYCQTQRCFQIDGYSLTCHTIPGFFYMELAKMEKKNPVYSKSKDFPWRESFIRENISSSYSFIIKIKRERGTFLISSLREKILILNICYTTLSSFKFTFCSITFT